VNADPAPTTYLRIAISIPLRKSFDYCLPDTWRAGKPTDLKNVSVCKKGTLLSYLNPVSRAEPSEETDPNITAGSKKRRKSRKSKRVIDREDLTPYLSPEFCLKE